MKNKKAKTVSSVIARKAHVITTAVLISVVLFSALSFLFYNFLTQNYHNDTVNTLYTISGKCTGLEYKASTHKRGNSYYIFTIDGEQYRLNRRNVSIQSSEDSALFEQTVLNADSVTLQYVIAMNGNAMVQGVELPGDKQFVDFEEVVKGNLSGINIAFVVLLILYLGCQSIIAVTTYFRLKELPGIKKALRKAKRKKERAESRENR